MRNSPNTNMQVFGAVQQIFGVEFTQTKGTKKQGCYVTDDAGEKQKITIYPGNNPILEQFHVGQRLEFNLSARPNERKPGEFYYGGFWECANPQQTQQPPQGQQQGSQAPPQQQNQQQPPQTPPPQQQQPQDPQADPNWKPRRSQEYAYEVTPVVAERIARSVALEAASRVMIGKTDCASQDVLSMAITFYDWVATGNIPMTPADQPGREPGEDYENFQVPQPGDQ